MTVALCIAGYLLVGSISCGALYTINYARGGDEYAMLTVAAICAVPFWPVVLPATLAVVGGEHLGKHLRDKRYEREQIAAAERSEQERILREAGL